MFPIREMTEPRNDVALKRLFTVILNNAVHCITRVRYVDYFLCSKCAVQPVAQRSRMRYLLVRISHAQHASRPGSGDHLPPGRERPDASHHEARGACFGITDQGGTQEREMHSAAKDCNAVRGLREAATRP